MGAPRHRPFRQAECSAQNRHPDLVGIATGRHLVHCRSEVLNGVEVANDTTDPGTLGRHSEGQGVIGFLRRVTDFLARQILHAVQSRRSTGTNQRRIAEPKAPMRTPNECGTNGSTEWPHPTGGRAGQPSELEQIVAFLAADARTPGNAGIHRMTGRARPWVGEGWPQRTQFPLWPGTLNRSPDAASASTLAARRRNPYSGQNERHSSARRKWAPRSRRTNNPARGNRRGLGG